MRSPLFIELALWYYTTPGDHPSVLQGAPAYREAVLEMVHLELLDQTRNEDVIYRSTEGMRVYVNALCKVRTPEKRWTIPDES